MRSDVDAEESLLEFEAPKIAISLGKILGFAPISIEIPLPKIRNPFSAVRSRPLMLPFKRLEVRFRAWWDALGSIPRFDGTTRAAMELEILDAAASKIRSVEFSLAPRKLEIDLALNALQPYRIKTDAVVNAAKNQLVSLAAQAATPAVAATRSASSSTVSAPTAAAVSTAAPIDPPPAVCDGQKMDTVRFFVIDTSEGLDLGARERIASDVENLVASEPGSSTGLVLLYPNAQSSYEPVQLSGQCLEPAASKLDAWLLLSRNAKNESAERLERSKRALRAAAGKALEKSQAGGDHSPIAGTIIYISKRPEFLRAKVREIFVYSDMRQHSAASTVYGVASDPAYFRLTHFRRANLQGGALTVLHLNRSEPIPGDAQLLSFWKKWAAGVNGRMQWIE